MVVISLSISLCSSRLWSSASFLHCCSTVVPAHVHVIKWQGKKRKGRKSFVLETPSRFIALRIHQILTDKWGSGEHSDYLLSHSPHSPACLLDLSSSLDLSAHLPQQRWYKGLFIGVSDRSFSALCPAVSPHCHSVLMKHQLIMHDTITAFVHL